MLVGSIDKRPASFIYVGRDCSRSNISFEHAHSPSIIFYLKPALSTMELLLCYKVDITRWVREGRSHFEVSSLLVSKHPGKRGLSERSVRRFCKDHGIHYRSGLANSQLDAEVCRAVRSVGHYYGRKTIQGLLRARGIRVSQSRVSKALRRVAPVAISARENFASRQLNPLPYQASFYGEKHHIDQNEKLNRFGVTHVLAVDGFSRKIVGLITLPIKNAIAIYHALMRPLLISEGMWQQVRVDHGTEFCLLIAIQQHLANMQPQQNRHLWYPVMQSTSTHNHRVERLWVEVNRRVNYPIKRILVALEANGIIDLSSNVIKFCVSYSTIKVLAEALLLLVQSWNNHRIPGASGGVPNVLASSRNNITSIPRCQISTTDQAIHLFTNNGGHLTPESSFGQDPLQKFPPLQKLRERDFCNRFPSTAHVFENVIHSDGSVFVDYLQFFIELTQRYSAFCSN